MTPPHGYRTRDGWRTWEALKLATGFSFPGGVGYYDPEDPNVDTRPLTERVFEGDWHAIGQRKIADGKPPSEPEVVPAKLWRFLILNPDDDSATGGGIEFVGLRWYNCPPPEAEVKDKPLRRGAQEDRLRVQGAAGVLWKQHPNWNQQQIVDHLPENTRKPRVLRTLLNWVREVDPRPPEKRPGRPREK